MSIEAHNLPPLNPTGCPTRKGWLAAAAGGGGCTAWRCAARSRARTGHDTVAVAVLLLEAQARIQRDAGHVLTEDLQIGRAARRAGRACCAPASFRGRRRSTGETAMQKSATMPSSSTLMPQARLPAWAKRAAPAIRGKTVRDVLGDIGPAVAVGPGRVSTRAWRDRSQSTRAGQQHQPKPSGSPPSSRPPTAEYSIHAPTARQVGGYESQAGSPGRRSRCHAPTRTRPHGQARCRTRCGRAVARVLPRGSIAPVRAGRAWHA